VHSNRTNLQNGQQSSGAAVLGNRRGIMSSTLGVIRSTTLSLVLSVATLALASGEANAQYPGYGWGYDSQATGYGSSAGPSGYGITGFDYGLSAFGFPNYGYAGQGIGDGYALGVGGFDSGLSAFGFPNYGYAGQGVGDGYGLGGLDYGLSALGFPSYPNGGGQAYGDGGTATGFPYMNSPFGVGMTALGNQGFVNESNRPGRGQLQADRRARARNLRQQRGR